MLQQPKLGYFNTGEVALNYAERTGDNPAILFIHGITGRHETWDEVADAIRGESRSVAVDLRGHGRSGHTTGAYRLSDYAGDMANLIEGLDLAPAIVIGHSLGAMTACWLAAERPDLVGATVLEDPPLFARQIMEEFAADRHDRFTHNARLSGSGLSMEQMAEQIRAVSPDATEEEVQKSALSLFVTDDDALEHVVDQRLDWSHELEEKLRLIKCPTLLMQGNFELGAWMLAHDGKRAMDLISDCRLETWDDTGHLLHSDNPDRFIEQVGSFVAGLKTAGVNR